MPIIVYGRTGCPPCMATKMLLERCGLAFEERSADHPEAQALAAERGFNAAPVVVAGSRAWCGFRPDEIAAILAETVTAASCPPNASL